MREVNIARLRPEEVLRERKRCSVAYLPLGPIEWHGPHLPLGTDPIRATEVARRVARRVGGVVMPTLWWGTETVRGPTELNSIGFAKGERVVGMDFPANPLKSMYCDEGIFGAIVRESLFHLKGWGYRMIVLVNGHGAANQKKTLDRLCAELTDSRTHILHVMPVVVARDGWADWGHATRLETSVMMELLPDSVKIGNLPLTGRLGNRDYAIVDDRTFRAKPRRDRTVRDEDDPRGACAEEGRADLRAAARRVASLVERTLRQLRK